MEKRYSCEDLVGIVETLRSENGCPWDKKQTHGSLKPCMTEEAAELVASIRIFEKTGHAENMREELGDILFQVVMHAQIAKEEKLFTLEDVVHEISAKMVRRHPHVFGDNGAQEESAFLPADGPDRGEENTSRCETNISRCETNISRWEMIKSREKEGKEWIETPLREIPKELPALARAAKVLKKADSLYRPGNDYYQDVMELERCVNRLKEHRPETEEEPEETLEEIIGDLLIHISDICRQFGLPPEQILTDRIEDLIDRYETAPKP